MIKRMAIPLLLLAVVLWGLGQRSPQEEVTDHFLAERERLEGIALRVLAGEEPSQMDLPGDWRSVTLHDHGPETVEFSFGGSGLGSSTAYWGVNYVPSGVEVCFQGSRWDYWKDQGKGRLYYDPEGDNTCYVERLDTCWYYYETRF